MKMIGLVGSPRAGGNTEKLVKAVLDGAGEKGADVVLYNLEELDIHACTACGDCRDGGICSINDDMQLLYDEIQKSDVVVFGSPIYMFNITAQAKAFEDRLYAFLKPDFISRVKPGKKAVLIFTQGNPDIDAFNHSFKDHISLFSLAGFEVKEPIIAGGTLGEDDILDQPYLLERAKQMGECLFDKVC